MRSLALFARAPAAGRVKTRLAPALPPAAAAALYAGLLADAFAAGCRARTDTRAVCWAGGAGGRPPGWRACAQRGVGLGARLEHAFAELLADGTSHVLIAGTDTPALAPAHLERAFELLERHAAVAGPSRDGGYWCIGLRRPAPALFRDVPWSTDRVLDVTLSRARDAGLDLACTDTLADLDTPADLARALGEWAAGQPTFGSHTRAALVALGLAPAAALSATRGRSAGGASR